MSRTHALRGTVKGLELTPASVRSCLAPASGSSSGLALHSRLFSRVRSSRTTALDCYPLIRYLRERARRFPFLTHKIPDTVYWRIALSALRGGYLSEQYFPGYAYSAA